MADLPIALDPALAPIACWRFVPSGRAHWQPGRLTHDPDLDGWSWEDAQDPDEAPSEMTKAYWTPPLLDAHTHLGDAFLRPARENLPRSIQALVAPPHGVKHKELARADMDQVHQAMHERAHRMVKCGTKSVLDFREGGVEGLKTLLSAVSGTGLEAHGLARPDAGPDDAEDWYEQANDLLLSPSLGLGLSGVRDLPRGRLEDAAELCRRNGKHLALHLSEARHEPVEEALRYEARILVHLVHAPPEEWDALCDAGVLAVACPSSNRFFGLKSPLDRFYHAAREQGLPTAVGTDNAMLGDGDLRAEAGLVCEALPKGDLDWLLRSLCWNPWRVLDLGPDPRHPGLLWGVDRKTPGSHPEETPLERTSQLWAHAPRWAPRIGGGA